MSKVNYTFLIVTPSFNQGQYIQQTIDSVLSQGIAVKYVVMDGKSTDSTVSVLKKYKSKLIWESKKDKGQTDAINKGIHYFKKIIKNSKKNTKYIFAYINSDDFYKANAFATVIKKFDENVSAQWIVGDYEVSSVKNNTFHAVIITSWKQLLKTLYGMNLLLIANPIPQPSTFIRWEAVEKIGLFNEKLSYVMDYEYWLRMQKRFGNPLFLTEKLSVFRIHQVSKGGSLFVKQFNEQYKIAQQYTSNQTVLFLHRLHNWLVIQLYRLTK